jgi:tryptophan synthase alpha chain
MNRIEKTFQRTSPFIGYLTGGDGGLDYSAACALAMLKGGVDILEIGLPFSDPVADGSVIQKAHERALTAGTTSAGILEIARHVRQTDSNVPLILFSYLNPLLQKGAPYLYQLKEAGFDAVLTVDLPVPIHGSQEPFFAQLETAGLLPICLATPSTEESRLPSISKAAKGFLYYVTQKGTTGARSTLASDFAAQIARLRPYFQLPIAAGFGIADRRSAREALQSADGFVTGSAFVQKMEEKIAPQELTLFVQSIDPRKTSLETMH